METGGKEREKVDFKVNPCKDEIGGKKNRGGKGGGCKKRRVKTRCKTY